MNGTEEVRLEDLGRRGITRVRVLRPSDVERMIRHVLAEALLADGRAGEELVRATRGALLARMKEAQARIVEGDRIEVEIDRLRAANARAAEEVAEARTFLAGAEAAMGEVEAEGERLEREGRELAAAIAGAVSVSGPGGGER